MFTTIAVIVAVLGGFVAGHLANDVDKDTKHSHVWRKVAASPFKEVKEHAYEVGTHKTRILCVCFCSETKVNVVLGHWTLEQLTDGQP